jgi:hypothetical protein
MDAEYLLLRGAGMLQSGPPQAPSTIVDWFALLQKDRLIGLTLLNLFDLINFTLVGLIFLALLAALRKSAQSLMILATVLALAGISIYFATNQALAMLSLSTQYAATNAPDERSLLLAAGQAVLTIHQNTGYQGSGLYISFLLVSIAGLIISFVMLKGDTFSPRCAFSGIAANLLGLGYYPILVIAPGLVFLPLSLSALFLLAWYIMISFRLWIISSPQVGA